jgi:hypothetical protein
MVEQIRRMETAEVRCLREDLVYKMADHNRNKVVKDLIIFFFFPWPPPQNPAEFLGGFSTILYFTG